MKTQNIPEFILPDWPAPANVHACSTTRVGGFSQKPFDSFNLGVRSADTADNVLKNRALLQEKMNLPTAPCWLWQVHGTRVVDAARAGRDEQADAAWTQLPGTVCTVMTADCLPVLFADRTGSCVAAAHAGWRGLLNGVLESVIDSLPVAPTQLCAWLGPSIGLSAFEVGADVYDVFCIQDDTNKTHFQRTETPGKWIANLPGLARQRLQKAGVTSLFGGNWCTYTDRQRFFSYRRDGAHSGRMATLIWIEA